MDFSNINKNSETRKINNIDYLYKEDNLLNAEYLFFNGEISKEKNCAISSLLKDDFINEEFYDIIIITVDFLEDNSAKNFIEDFQSFTRQKIKQPFILFLTLKEENPNIECLYNQI
jgi:hypothetical protein